MEQTVVGITGKKYSGKDAVRLILQLLVSVSDRLYAPPVYREGVIYAIQQQLMSPKVFFPSNMSFYIEPSKVVNYKFAEPIKQVATTLLGVDRSFIETEEFKETKTLLGITGRELLVRIGDDFGRNILGIDTWVTTLKDSISKYAELITIDDLRRHNEMQLVLDMGGIILRVERDAKLREPEIYKEYQYYMEHSKHNLSFNEYANMKDIKRLTCASETELDNSSFDYVIYNNSTDDFRTLINDVIKFGIYSGILEKYNPKVLEYV